MSIKVEATQTQPIDRPNLPQLMINKNSGLIIIATKDDGNYVVGTVINPGREGNPIGFFTTTWTKGLLVPFYGTITIVSEKE
jgi:hypothetical protein